MADLEATSVFASPPRIEVHHRGVWYAGELLGWRFDDSGRCIARVRCVVDGLRHSAWTELTDLRLPEPTTPPRREVPEPPRVVPVPEEHRVLPVPEPPAVRWASIGRHEHAAPAWTPSPPGPRHQPLLDDDTRPHALLVDRDLRAPVPRPAPRARLQQSRPAIDAG